MTAAPATDRPSASFPWIEPGDFAPNFELFDQRGERFTLYDDAVVGRPAVLFFPPGPSGEGQPSAGLDAARRLRAHAAARDLTVAVIMPAPTGVSESGPGPSEGPAGSGLRLLTDEAGRVRRAFGVAEGRASTIVLDPQCRLRARLDATEDPAHAEAVVREVERMHASRGSGMMRPHPPVLWISDVLDPAECRVLIGVWERRHHGDGGAAEDRDDRPGTGDADSLKAVEGKIGRRVIPQILKAFHYRVTRRESFHIGCADESGSGDNRPYRYDAAPNRTHRRFTMVLNLNAEEHQGGELRFREYGDQLYRPGTGAALVFSSALLQEAMPVTAGRRFVLISHFFGDDARPPRPAADAPDAAGGRP